MARFVVELVDGKLTTELEAEPGEELSPEQVRAYHDMRTSYSIWQISERIGELLIAADNLIDRLDTVIDRLSND